MKKTFIIVTTVTLLNSITFAIDLTTCIGCHGQDFEKSAMNISPIVKDLKASEIRKALKGYKEGSRGGAMKDTMNRQISKFTDKEIEKIITIITTNKIAEYINLDSNKSKKEIPQIEVSSDNCISCHGVNFEKSAMGYSRIVNRMSKEDIIASLNGYKSGTYGGTMKALMATQATKLSRQEIEIVAQMISNLSSN